MKLVTFGLCPLPGCKKDIKCIEKIFYVAVYFRVRNVRRYFCGNLGI
jgi:hypothetical protein